MYEIDGGSRPWRSATGAMSRSGARERPRGACVLLCERDARQPAGGGNARETRGSRRGEAVLCMRDQRRGGGGLSLCAMCEREQRGEGVVRVL
jgi:hypothetical protein